MKSHLLLLQVPSCCSLRNCCLYKPVSVTMCLYFSFPLCRPLGNGGTANTLGSVDLCHKLGLPGSATVMDRPSCFLGQVLQSRQWAQGALQHPLVPHPTPTGSPIVCLQPLLFLETLSHSFTETLGWGLFIILSLLSQGPPNSPAQTTACPYTVRAPLAER